MSVRTVSVALSVAGLAIIAASGARAAVVDSIQVMTSYQFDAPPDNQGPYSGQPDTSFITFTNVGNTTFVGTLGDVAVSQFAGDYSLSFNNVTLAPGQSFVFGTSYESSNVGGFNGPYGSLQPGIEVDIAGAFSDGYNAAWSVNDADIHSGVFSTNPFGVVVDSWVLQGGDPYGQDTGDDFEVSQAPGLYTFTHTSGVPEPETWAMMAIGFAALGFTGYRSSRRKISIAA